MDPEVLARWWTVLGDPVLTGLVERAVKGNLELREARGRVREARARRGISGAGLLPAVGASGSATKSRGSEELGGGAERDLYSAGLDARWELDIFGGLRRSVEAAEADLEASREDLRDVLVTLLSEVALNYVDLRSFQERIAIAEANLDAQRETHDIVRWRFEAGLANQLEVDQSRLNLEQTRSQIPPLRTAALQALNRLSVLLGESPGSLRDELSGGGSVPVTPLEVAVGVPADALRQRPDVRRAERQLAAQTARVGVAVADLYPKFTLSGSIGLEALEPGKLFSAGSRAFSSGPGFTWNVFSGGALRRNIEAQTAAEEQALARYESTVLAALEEVENALAAYAQEQARRQSLAEAAGAARSAVELSLQQYTSGLIDFQTVLDSQRSLLSLEDQLASSGSEVTSNLIRLYKALGGGWTSLAPDSGPATEEIMDQARKTDGR